VLFKDIEVKNMGFFRKYIKNIDKIKKKKRKKKNNLWQNMSTVLMYIIDT